MASAVLSAVALAAQQLDAGFALRAHKHVEALAALGPRLPGTAADRKAEQYIAKHMRRAGLAVAIERFEFDYFRLDGADIAVSGASETVERVILDPYGGRLEFAGAPLFLSGENLGSADNLIQSSRGRIVIAGPKTRLTQ